MKRIFNVFSLAIICALMFAALGLPVTPALADSATTFDHTGAEQTYTVPDAVFCIAVDAYGAQGGNGQGYTYTFYSPDVYDVLGGNGGNGNRVQTTLTVTPGETLYVYVGGQGGQGVQTAGGYNGGGFNGGGSGGQNASTGTGGGGGGGASDVRQAGSGLGNRVVIAGGGGGGGGAGGISTGGDYAGDNGGNGGGATGVNDNVWIYRGRGGGWLGTISNGGPGNGNFNVGSNGGDGSTGTGGNGGDGLYNGWGGSGGGGGGGDIGGGGGGGGGDTTNNVYRTGSGGGGGAMGSDLAAGGTATTGVRSGNGQVILTPIACPDHTVTFNANGGSGSMDSQTTNVATNLTTNTFTRSGYTFNGWNTNADGSSGTDYANGASYAFDANVTLYAKWAANHTVTFEANGGTGSMSNQISGGASNLSTNTFTRTGYSFNGWNTNADGVSGTNYANGASYAFDADVTLYAKWTDASEPSVISSVRVNPSPSNLASVSFTVTFSEPVTGVGLSDFSLTTAGVSSPAVSGISGSGSVYTVTVNTGTGNGTIRLDVLDDDSIKDAALNPLAAGFTAGESYTVSKSPVFEDVPFDYWANSFIERLAKAGITGGCSAVPLNYCPDSTVTRAQMAVFLLKSMHGSSFTPPTVGVSTGFGDVAIDYWAAAWIKQLAAEGITSGCGNANYCPDATVTRAQMAVFLLKAKNGSGYTPPAVGVSTGFADVATNYWAAAFIKQLVTDGITSGCGGGNYCPDADVTRAQMAVFLVKTFNLP